MKILNFFKNPFTCAFTFNLNETPKLQTLLHSLKVKQWFSWTHSEADQKERCCTCSCHWLLQRPLLSTGERLRKVHFAFSGQDHYLHDAAICSCTTVSIILTIKNKEYLREHCIVGILRFTNNTVELVCNSNTVCLLLLFFWGVGWGGGAERHEWPHQLRASWQGWGKWSALLLLAPLPLFLLLILFFFCTVSTFCKFLP